MAVLQTDSKCSNTVVYAPLLTRFAPCPWTLPAIFETALRYFKKGDTE
jgi:hypothetical protein